MLFIAPALGSVHKERISNTSTKHNTQDTYMHANTKNRAYWNSAPYVVSTISIRYVFIVC